MCGAFLNLFFYSIDSPRAQAIFKILALLFVFSFEPAFANSGFDVLTAARVSLSSTQSLLAAPPLPSLETNEKFVISVQGGYVSGHAEGDDYSTRQSAYRGNFYGESFGLGLTSSSYKNLSYFGMLVGNTLGGELSGTSTDGKQISWWRNMSTQGVDAMAGAQYRIYGERRSPFVLGIFAGPVWISLKSSFQPEYVNPSSGAVTLGDKYHADPTMYGVMAGVQGKIRLNSFLFSPYGMYLQEIRGIMARILYDHKKLIGEVSDWALESQPPAYKNVLGKTVLSTPANDECTFVSPKPVNRKSALTIVEDEKLEHVLQLKSVKGGVFVVAKIISTKTL